jgi:hypothetical protein
MARGTKQGYKLTMVMLGIHVMSPLRLYFSARQKNYVQLKFHLSLLFELSFFFQK